MSRWQIDEVAWSSDGYHTVTFKTKFHLKPAELLTNQIHEENQSSKKEDFDAQIILFYYAGESSEIIQIFSINNVTFERTTC